MQKKNISLSFFFFLFSLIADSYTHEWDANICDSHQTIETTQPQFTHEDSSNNRIEVFESENDITISVILNEDIDAHAQSKSTEKQMSEVVGSTKRQRKSKGASGTKAEQKKNVVIKPKRSRATKPKANPIESEQASSIPLNNDGVAGKFNTKINIFVL